LNSEVLEFANSLVFSTLVSSGFLIGALLSIIFRYPERLRADLSAFAAGIFLSSIAFSLIDDALKEGSFITMALGFGVGAVAFSVMNRILQKIKENQDQKRKESEMKSGESNNTSGTPRSSGNSSRIMIVGIFLDSFPESIFIGVIIALDIEGLIAATLALFIGNLAATMEGSKRMFEENRQRFQTLKQWVYIFVIISIGGPIGWYLEKPLSPEQLSIIIGFAAGALMAFITEELIPQAYKRAELHIGLSSSFGFLLGLALFQLF
jgi:ZIP family zinc transporter